MPPAERRHGGLRIVHVAPFLWSGAGQVITSLVESQSARHAVTVVTSGTSRGERDWPTYRTRLRRCGADWRRVDLFDREPAVFWPSVRRLQSLIAQMRPDVVHSHAGVPACAVALAGGPTPGFRHVSQVYSWGLGRPAWMDEMDVWGHAQADVVVVSCDAYRKALLSGGVDPRRLRSLRWGLAPHTITAARRVPRHPVIGFAGRIERRKRQADLVEAFATVHAADPEARLELVGPVGDAGYAAEVRRVIATRGLERVVRLRGLVPSVPRVVARWTLFVSLSADEGQGLAVLEAMALGVPVAAVRCAGVEDYVEPGQNAVALEGAGPNAIGAELLAALGERPMLDRIAAAGQHTAATRFSWNDTVDRFESLYGGRRRHARVNL